MADSLKEAIEHLVMQVEAGRRGNAEFADTEDLAQVKIFLTTLDKDRDMTLPTFDVAPLPTRCRACGRPFK